ncbi:uncharacterized protein LOC124705459 [Lolium rigidum]|uniref:uncharacterized protein LOC124705459 n=1 Tax=Lolium rigidum TaxID=89674 RepID=UPI001F5DDCD9|nr:uncharacterized protein LOC124705459 [Lolium rigidum]XP_047093135.1 uncharacterized protein LOC124705459 [Lolium rigidum]
MTKKQRLPPQHLHHVTYILRLRVSMAATSNFLQCWQPSKRCLLHGLTRSGKGFILDPPSAYDFVAVKRHVICLCQWHTLRILDEESRETLMLHTAIPTIDDLMSLCQRCSTRYTNIMELEDIHSVRSSSWCIILPVVCAHLSDKGELYLFWSN